MRLSGTEWDYLGLLLGVKYRCTNERRKKYDGERRLT